MPHVTTISKAVERKIAENSLQIEYLKDDQKKHKVISIKSLKMPVTLPIDSVRDVDKLDGWLDNFENYEATVRV